MLLNFRPKFVIMHFSRVLVYDDMHIIRDVINEMDYLINAVLWIDNSTREEEDE